MTKYKDLTDAMEQANRTKRARRAQAGQDLAKFIEGFRSYCGIPVTHIEALEWNAGTESYKESVDQRAHPVWSLLDDPDEQGFWHLGVRINLTTVGEWVSFHIGCALQEDGELPLFKLGLSGAPREIDLSDTAQCDEFYKEIFHKLRDVILDPKPQTARPLGFELSGT